MKYNQKATKTAYDNIASEEDRQEKAMSLRVEIPREYIKKYLKRDDTVLDAGGGTGINAIMMAKRCKHVTLYDLSTGVLNVAKRNVKKAGLENKIDIIQGDISDLNRFDNNQFSFIVCIGDSISYVLDKRYQAMKELTRVAKKGAYLIIGCDSKYGFIRLNLKLGNMNEAIKISKTSETKDFMGPMTHLYTTDEMKNLIEENGCKVLEIASTPTFSDTFDKSIYYNKKKWEKLKKLELEHCTKPELLGMGHHLLFIARKK